jgi:DNA-binding SARP family transcriptional activator/tetratricopeptide (TPR) repeat protein
MEFRVLGPVEAWDGEVQMPIGGPKQRALLALLLLNAGETLSTDRLIDELWGEHPPETAVKGVQVLVSQLRKLLGEQVIATRARGYAIEIDPEQLDLTHFERLAAEGRRALEAQEPQAARTKLREALALWRGSPLGDLSSEPFARTESARLEEIRLAAVEDRIDADLKAGMAGELVGELEALVARNPLREHLRRQLMLALYRSGRQAEALDVYRQTRAALVEQLGIEPGRELRELEQRILRQDEALVPATDSARISAPPRESKAPQPLAGTFVGREYERATLLAALDGALAGGGRVVLLSGEPGIGKTRLLEQFSNDCRDRGVQVAVGRCWEAGGAPAYWPWLQALRACMRDPPPEELLTRLGSGASDLGELLPELREVFPELPKPPALDPEGARFRLFDGVASFLVRTARERPLVVLLEDLHAADEPSLLLLRFVSSQLAGASVLVVVTTRDTETQPGSALETALAELSREASTVALALEGLAPAEVARFVELNLGRASEDAAAEIHARTGGNPLFVVELLRMLRGVGHFDAEGGIPSAVPKGVRQLISRRLQGLSQAARSVLAASSVLGHEFDIDTLELLPQLEDHPVLAALDEGVIAGFLGQSAGRPGRLRFSHALVRDAIYDALPPGRRIELHRLVGEALEDRYRDEPDPHLAELAHHFDQAAHRESAEKAAGYAERAGARAVAQLAYEQAAAHFEQALTGLERAGVVDARRRWTLERALGQAWMQAGDRERAADAFERAGALAKAVSAPELLAEAALGLGSGVMWADASIVSDPRLATLLEDALDALGDADDALRARLLARLAGERFSEGDEAGAKLSTEAVELARRSQDPEALAYALCARLLPWDVADPEGRLRVADEIIALAEGSAHVELALEGRIGRVVCLVQVGDLTAVEDEIEAYERQAEPLRQPAYVSWAKVWRAMLCALRGEFDDAERLGGEAFALAERGGHANAVSNLAGLLFDLRWLQGRLAELTDAADDVAEQFGGVWIAARVLLRAATGETEAARRELERLAADGFRGLGLGADAQVAMACLTMASAALDENRFAGALYERLRPDAHLMVTAAGAAICPGAVSGYLGQLSRLQRRFDDATRYFEDAIERNEAIGAAPHVAVTQCDFAEMLAERGGPRDRDQAAELLASATAIAQRQGIGQVLDRVAPLRSKLAGASAPAAGHTD